MTDPLDDKKETKGTRKRAAAAYAEASPTETAAEPTAQVHPSEQKAEGTHKEDSVNINRESSTQKNEESLGTGTAAKSASGSEAVQEGIMAQELEKAKMQANEYLDGWQRERADFTNYRKRIERDQIQLTQNITGNLVKKYLVILDDIDRAMKNRPTQGEAAAWAEGIELIQRKLQNVLEVEGVQPIDAAGKEFDPRYHEAVTHEENPDHPSGHVIEVLQNGYILGDRVIRPAQVRVAR
jgi:molecular chaperone GrpE